MIICDICKKKISPREEGEFDTVTKLGNLRLRVYVSISRARRRRASRRNVRRAYAIDVCRKCAGKIAKKALTEGK